MPSRRPVLPIVALVVAVAVLVGIRVWGGGSTVPEADGAGRTTTTSSPAAGRTGGIRFTDVTRAAGLATRQSTEERSGEQAMTSGAAVADVDGDGDPDLYLTRIGRPNALLRNDGRGHFTDVTQASGAGGPDPAQGSSAAAFADVDGDGNVDLVLTAAGRGGLTLLRGDGRGRFTDATAGSGLDTLPPMADGATSAQLHGLTFADYDRDGHLDLLVTHWDDVVPSALADPAADAVTPDRTGSLVCGRAAYLRARGFPRPPGSPANRARLFRNDGTGHFQDVTAAVGLSFDHVLGFTGSFQDVDGDGWPDLLLTGDFCTSRLYRNEGGTRFVDVTDAAGVGTDENGMGSVVRDVDGDGHPDWFVTGIGPVEGSAPDPALPTSYGHSGNRLYRNDGTGTFTDVTDRSGVRAGGWGWGAAIEDFGNDGRLEVVMTNGYDLDGTGASGGRPEATDPMRFWIPVGDGRHLEGSGAVGLSDPGIGHALVAFDADGDGDLDLLVAHSGSSPTLYRNDTPRRHRVDVRLDDPTTPGNRQGIGARVVVTAAGRDPVTQWVQTGGSYESQRPADVHVGLGGRSPGRVRVEVTWPDGGPPQIVPDAPVDRVVVVRRDRAGTS